MGNRRYEHVICAILYLWLSGLHGSRRGLNFWNGIHSRYQLTLEEILYDWDWEKFDMIGDLRRRKERSIMMRGVRRVKGVCSLFRYSYVLPSVMIMMIVVFGSWLYCYGQAEGAISAGQVKTLTVGADEYVETRADEEFGAEEEYLQSKLVEHGPADGEQSYLISSFSIEMRPADHPGHPAVEEIMALEIELAQSATGYVAPRAGEPTVVLRLADVPEDAVGRFYASAIRAISQSMVSYFNGLGLIGIYVAPRDEDIARLAKLGAEEEGGHVILVVWTGVVDEVRTVASGERVKSAERIDSRLHERIKEGSPILPAREGAEKKGDLIRRDLLDEYVFRLNRHPGRRVDIALSSSQEPGRVVLDYLVTESKPWLVYVQGSNTGTEGTNRWRERIGFIQNQLTGRDDILSVDYVTAGFDEAHALIGSYEAPLVGIDNVRGRVFGSWSQFDASEVGFREDRFESKEWSAGVELIGEVFQRRELFVDVFLGAEWRNIMVDNQAALTTGESDFLLSKVGLRIERYTNLSTMYGSLDVEWNCAGAAGTDADEVTELGREGAEAEWSVLHWDFSHSFFLEPLLNRAAWEDVETPRSSTLAHEVWLSVRGQHSLGNRLIPQEVGVVGGLYSVRGYPESVTNGDTVYIGSAEYRYHIPWGFKPRPEAGELLGRQFRWAPQQVYGRPDWDFMLRAFFDIGCTRNEEFADAGFESDQTLMGAGVGMELRFSRRLSVRVDWGVALDDLDEFSVASEDNLVRVVEMGDSQVHVAATILY